MSAAIGVWSVRVEPGEKASVYAHTHIRISNAALDAELEDQSARSSVLLTYVTAGMEDDEDDDEEDSQESLSDQSSHEDENKDEDEDEDIERSIASTILCSLTPGKIEQAPLDLVINEDEEVEFEVIGKNAIYLTGNYIALDLSVLGESDRDKDEDEDVWPHDFPPMGPNFGSDETDSDIDVDEQDDSHRFEEIAAEDEKEAKREARKAEEALSKKRPRESDEAEPVIDGEQKLSKKQLKKLNKKLKTENGAAVPNGESKVEAPKKDVPKKGSAKGEEKVEKGKELKKQQKGGEKGEEEKKLKKSNEDGAQKKGELKETPSGLKIKDVKAGTGKAAKKGDLVSMRYVGKLMNGKVFDSNTRETPFRFKLGLGEVIKGWDEGIVGMRVGGERLLIVPPKLGYGSRRAGDKIPPNSTLRFECKLVGIN